MKPGIQIILSIIFAFIICQLSYFIFSKGLHNYDDHKDERLSELFLQKTDYDLLFIGSSRTHSNVNPRVIDSICNSNSYNAGIEGGNLFEFKMVFEAYLQNHPPPKTLVLTIDLKSFDLKRRFYNYSQYFPYTENKIIDKTLNDYGHKTMLLKMFSFLVFTNYDDYTKGNAIKGLMGKSEIPKGDFKYKGYLSNSDATMQFNNTINIDKPTESEVTEEGKSDLNEIIKLCRKNRVRLMFTYAPEYKYGLQKTTANSNDIFLLIDSIAKQNNIIFLRDDSLSLCNDSKLFANTGHLNRNGAQVYSAVLANKIFSLIKN